MPYTALTPFEEYFCQVFSMSGIYTYTIPVIASLYSHSESCMKFKRIKECVYKNFWIFSLRMITTFCLSRNSFNHSGSSIVSFHNAVVSNAASYIGIHHRVILTICKHIVRQKPCSASRQIAIGVDEASNCRVVVAGLQVVEAGLDVVAIAQHATLLTLYLKCFL